MPEGKFNYLRNKTSAVKVDDDWNIIFNGNKYYYSDEAGANEEGGMARFENGADYGNGFEFKKAHVNGNELTNFVFLTKISLGYVYIVPLYGEIYSLHAKGLKPKSKKQTKDLLNLTD